MLCLVPTKNRDKGFVDVVTVASQVTHFAIPNYDKMLDNTTSLVLADMNFH